MTKRAIGVWIAALACSASFSGCVTNDQGTVVIDPRVSSAIIADLTAPANPPVVQAVPVYEEAYVPGPYDRYIVGVSDENVVVINGSTYIWVTGPDGKRSRHFYAHGDRREDVFHRRDNLHTVMTEHGGALPNHRIEAHMYTPPAHAGGQALAANNPGAGQAGGHGGSPMMHQAGQHPAPANRPAPKKEEKKEPKKS